MYFFPKLCAVNIGWHEKPKQWIKSYISPKGYLTKQGMSNFYENHQNEYIEFIKTIKT